MKVIAATHNKGKMVEMSDIVQKYGIELISWDDAGLGDLEIEETGTTCEENSLIKAQTIVNMKGVPAIADDSGLFVDALSGAPGVYSARYGDDEGIDGNVKLLRELEGVPYEKRTAHFLTVITLLYPDGKKLVAKGICKGHIALEKHGDRGFGYDPLFIPEGSDKTFAELPLEYKDANSHRAKALAELAKMIEE